MLLLAASKMVACVSDTPVLDGGADGSPADSFVAADGALDSPGCDGGLTSCGDAGCVDLQVSNDHCGQCFAACGSGPCTASECASRLVFVTNGVFNGNLGGVSGGDNICQQAATAAGRRGKYKAWLSRPGDSAIQRLENAKVPYKLPSGAIVAINWNNLVDMSIDNAINENEQGQAPADGGIGVWTGTFVGGGAATVHCNNWTSSLSSETGRVGDRNAIDANWTSFASYFCDAARRLYCFEQR